MFSDFLADVEDEDKPPAPKPKSTKSWSSILGTKKATTSNSKPTEGKDEKI